MNIAVFGWYHHRNAGDDRIERCLTRWLDGHTLAFLPAGRPPSIELLRTYDAAIIGGGGLIGGEPGGVFARTARWVRAAGIPVALAGVSVEAASPALVRELRGLLDRCCFAWFRDRGSLEAIGEHPRAFVAPDVTWLYPFDQAAPRVETQAVAVNLQPGRDLPLAEWREALSALGRPLEPWPLYFEGGGDATVLRPVLAREHGGEEIAMPGEFTLAPAREAVAAICARFHGLLFALQLGRPALAVSRAPKVCRFLAEHGLDRWRLDPDDPAGLARLWPAFIAARGELVATAHAMRARLHAEVWERTEPARARLLEAAAALPPPSRRFGDRLRRMLDLGRLF